MISSRISFNKLVFAVFIVSFVVILHSCEYDPFDSYKYTPPSIAPIASNITQTEAEIKGLAMYAESVFFEYGTSTSYGGSVSGGTFILTPNNGGQVSFVAHAHLTGLRPATTYHFRGVAKYRHKTNYSPDQTFTTISDKEPLNPIDYGTINDIEGNSYKTVKIGNQEWMAENLKSTKYNNGNPIPNVTDNTEWINLTTEGYCYYNNDISNKGIYGTLYNWYTVRNGSLCPAGWHVPSDMEYLTLINFLGGQAGAGGKLKQAGTALWINPNSGATNESGFTALPSGDRIGSEGHFYNLGGYSIYWTTDEAPSGYAINRVLAFDVTNFRIGYDKKTAGFSVRCIKDN